RQTTPEALKVGHFRSGEYHPEMIVLPPGALGRAQEIHAALLLAVVGEVPDHHLVRADAPSSANIVPVAARAFLERDAHALEHELFAGGTDSAQGVALDVGLYEDTIGGAKE